MAKIVLGTFGSNEEAERGADRLKRAGFSEDDISLLGKDQRERGAQQGGAGGDAGGDTMMGQTSEGMTWGSGLGAGAGLLASAGALAVPGIGPLLAAGPLAATLSGAVTGGLAGGLADWGLPEEQGRQYEERVRQGRTLCAVRCGEQQADRARDTLRQAGADDVDARDERQR